MCFYWRDDSRQRWLVGCVALTLLLGVTPPDAAWLVSAQSPPASGAQGTPPPAVPPKPASPQIAPQPPPSFQTQAVTIEVDVIVRDKGGKFVTGLQPGDFEVTEDGIAQTFHSMYFVQGKTATPDLMRPGGALAPHAGAAGQPAGGASGAPSNQAAAPPRVFVLFFDQDHMDSNGFKRLQDAAEKFLTTEFQAGDVGGVLVGGTMVGNRLSSDREVLLQAIRTAKFSAVQAARKLDLMDYPRISEVEAIRIALANDRDILAQVVRRASSDGPQSGGRGGGPDLEGEVRQKAQMIVSGLRAPAAQTIRTLLALANGLARIPGRKTIVFLTDGFYVEESWGQLRGIVEIAARSNVRVYAIDAQGLQRRSNATSLSQMNPLDTGATIPTDAYNTVEEGPNTLAVDTGGYVIRNTNDFTGALKEIAADTSTYYVLGYSPINAKFDGKFRTISVKVKKPGVSVRARKGYVATAPSSAPALDAMPAPAAEPATVPKATPPVAPAVVPPPDAAAAAAGESVPSLTLPLEGIALRPDGAARVRNLASMSTDSAASKSLASQGWDRYTKGDLEGAEPLLAKAAGQAGAAPWVSYALGFAEVGLKKPAAAVRSWERVRAEAPQFEPVYVDLADVYIQVNDPDRAIETLRAAEKRWPSDVDILNALGTVQVRRGAHTDAIATFEKAIAAKPDDGLAYFNLARTCELRYYALRRFSRPNARWIDNPELLTRARENYEAYIKLGGPFLEEAQAALKRILSR